ncbi:MAG: SusC/RagA family TonB-linked outer membrane protein [Cellulophaga fucicola]
MRKKVTWILTPLLVMLMSFSYAQEKTITGSVTDQDGLPLPGVSVLVVGTAIGTQSDFDGNYTISAKVGQVLRYSYIGQKTTDRTVGVSSTINLQMEEDAEALEEVVVTAYGVQKKESLTGSIAEIKSEEIAKVASGNAVTGLTGKVSGVQIFSNSGQPGTAPTVRFRGIGSLNGSSAPLYVVDGVPYNESITSLNPNDIESISFLKDAAAAALYGNRGANGVIIVTTKKGKAGKVSVTLDVRTSFTSRATKDYDVFDDAGEYLEAYHKMLKNNDIVENGTDVATAGLNASTNLFDGPQGLVYNPFGGDRATVIDPNTGKLRSGNQLWTSDWEDELFNDGSGIQTLYASIAGGTEKATYFFSVGNEDNTGYNVNTGFKRLTLNMNLSSQVSDNIRLGMSANYANREQTGTLTNNITGNFAWVRNIAPIYPVFAVDHATGATVLDEKGNPLWDWADVTSPNATAGRPFNGFSNPHALQTLNVNKSVRDNLTSRAFAEIKFLKDFTFTYNFGLDLAFYNTTNYTNKIVGSSASSDVNGRLSEQFGRGTTYTNQQLLGWKKTIADDHHLDILLGHENSDYNFKFLDANKKNQFISNDISASLFAENDGAGNVTGGPTEYLLEGFFARMLYDFDNKYYINGSFRRDGSSVFSEDNRWGNFWGAGVAWRISKESFMDNVDWISELKLKSSIGQQGNDYVGYPDNTAVRNYAPYLDQWDVTTDGEEFNLSKTVLGNKDLKWETSTNFNAGFELNMFDNRLRIESEYFQRKITDLIFNRPLPNSSGLPSIPENVMDMQNVGVEASIAYDIIRSKNLNWTVDLNATHYKNEITKLAPGRDFIDPGTVYRWEKGSSAFDYYIRDFVGVNPTNGNAIWYTSSEFEADGTTPIINNQTEDYSVASETNLGKSALPDVNGGFTSSLTYKNLDFSFALSYQFGGYAFDAIYNDAFGGGIGENLSRDFYKTWTYDNTTASLPRVIDGSRNYNTSDLLLEKSDFISLNDVSIGYTLPNDVVEKIGLSKVRIYGLGNNLALWTASGRDGFDPRASVTGGNNSVRYATLKTFSLGLNVNF